MRILILIVSMLLVSGRAYGVEGERRGAVATGEYPNVLREIGLTDAEIEARIEAVWQSLFYGDDATERVYYPVGDDMAYILDVNNQDVRSEGMSYGMMIAVQLDRKEEFDRLWRWAKTYMYHESGQYKGYFSWHNRPDGTRINRNPASDGEIWFAMALFFAAQRWGNGEGIFNYEAQANAILHTMINTEGSRSGATNMFNRDNKMVVFVPDFGRVSEFTNPSYHTPYFYELWACWAAEENEFWAEAAAASRAFWPTTTHPETGLTPNYAEFTGEPVPWDNYGEYFYADAWRTAMHIAVDYSWFRADEWQVEQSNRLLRFFYGLGIDRYNSRFLIDGTPSEPQHRALGLIAMNAVAALAADDPIRLEFVRAFWEAPLTRGEYRYYDNLLYMLALLHLSGRFQAHGTCA
ncbi:MAG: glycosyl hydrolase family 8 [Anaerolineae bacterium]